MGLVLDAISCLKTAFEALQYSRLISLSPEEASTFLDPEKSLRPVEVRKRLEKLGHDVDQARDRYSILSTFAHVGGAGETLTLERINENVAFRIGGYIDVELQREILQNCDKAIGEFIAFNAGVRQENVEVYHQTIRAWDAEGISADEILRRIPELMKENS